MDARSTDGVWPQAARWLIRSSRISLLVMFCLVIVAHWPASRLELDQRIESLFSDSDPVLISFRESRDAFGGDAFVFVAYEAPDLYVTSRNPDGESVESINSTRLEEIKDFADRLSEVPGVLPASTQDLGHMIAPEGENLPRGIRFLMRLPTIAEKAVSFAESVLVSPDRKTVGVVLRIDPMLQATGEAAATIDQIRRMAADHQPPALVVGEPVQLADTFRYIEQDGLLLGWCSAILLSIVIAYLFRSLRWVVLPLLIVYSSLVLTEATLVLLGLRLSMVSSVLSALITVIGIATAMHVIVRFRRIHDESVCGKSPSEEERIAARERDVIQTFIDLGPPVFWTCLTTALGFLALTSSQILPVRSFGIMMAIGTGMVFLTTMTMLPGGMVINFERRVKGPCQADRLTVGALGELVAHLRRYGWWWLGGTVLVSVIAAVGLTRLEVETDFSKNFRDSSQIVRALEFFETRMGGAGSWELLMSLDGPLDDADLDATRELAEELRQLRTDGGARITKVVAVTDGLDLIPKVATRFARQTREEILEDFQPEFLPSLYNEEQSLLRVVLRSNEREQSDEKLALIEKARATAQKYNATAEPTGTFLMMAMIVESLLADQWISFTLATVMITGAMALAFRSLKYGLISLFPNAFPIAMVLGVIGWLEIPVNMGTAMIASVSVGLTVDSSIHYLAAYRRARGMGRDHWSALQQAHSGTGKALVYSHIALVGGFSVLALSNFVPLIYFGVLVSAAMVAGLFGDLVILPMLLTLAEREPSGSIRDENIEGESSQQIAVAAGIE